LKNSPAKGAAGAIRGDPPKKILLGERAIMADGNDYNLGGCSRTTASRVQAVYATEGSR